MPQQRRHSRVILGVLSLGLLVGVALTAKPTQAVDAVGPYYAEPAWDQKLPANTRFVVLTNWGSKAVLDKETGLVWERSPATTTHTWSAALFECTARTTGNRKGWRLPSMHDYASLVEPPHQHPALALGHPFLTVQSVSYWSATTNAANTTEAWYMFFDIGFLNFGSKTSPNHVWCVRGSNNLAKY